MSFTFPHPFSKASHQPPSFAERPLVELPEFENPQAIKVLPYDTGVSDVAETALRFAGVDILKSKFGVTDITEARAKVQSVASDITALGVEAAHEHNPLFDQVTVPPDDILDKTSYGFATLKNKKSASAPVRRRSPMGQKLEPVKVLPEGVSSESELVTKQIEALWQEKAIEGDDAALVLLSLNKLANTPERGFAADRAADLISDIQPNDTRIALK